MKKNPTTKKSFLTWVRSKVCWITLAGEDISLRKLCTWYGCNFNIDSQSIFQMHYLFLWMYSPENACCVLVTLRLLPWYILKQQCQGYTYSSIKQAIYTEGTLFHIHLSVGPPLRGARVTLWADLNCYCGFSAHFCRYTILENVKDGKSEATLAQKFELYFICMFLASIFYFMLLSALWYS